MKKDKYEIFKTTVKTRKLKPLSKISKKLREIAAEAIIDYELAGWGIKTKKGFLHIDRFGYNKDVGLNEVNLQYKPISLKRPKLIFISQKALRDFKGFYIVLIELETEHIEDRYEYFIIPDDDMRKRIEKEGYLKTWDKVHKEKRWVLKFTETLRDEWTRLEYHNNFDLIKEAIKGETAL